MIPRWSLLENIMQFRKYVRMPLDTYFLRSSTSQRKKHQIKFSRAASSHEPGAGAQEAAVRNVARHPWNPERPRGRPLAGSVGRRQARRPRSWVTGGGAGGSAAAAPRGGTARPRVGPHLPPAGRHSRGQPPAPFPGCGCRLGDEAKQNPKETPSS